MLRGDYRFQLPEGPRIQPYPGATTAPTMWDHCSAGRLNHDLVDIGYDPERAIARLTQFIFEVSPQVLDLPPAVAHRFGEAKKVAATYPDGETALQASILAHFQTVEQALEEGWVPTATATIYDPDPTWPRPELHNGQFIQRLHLPQSIQHKTLAWNRWMQNQIRAGNIETVFSKHPEWVGLKLSAGTWLPVGNLMIEAGETLMRLPDEVPYSTLVRWGLDMDGPGIHGPEHSQWFVMTHIIDKELLRLSASLDANIIDGMQLTPEVYARSYVPILELIERNPELNIKGVLSDGTWIYSSELPKRFPHQHVAGLHSIAGDIVDLGPAQELGMLAQIAFATHDRERREAFLRGEYEVTVAARFIDPTSMRAVVEQFGLT